MNKKNAVILTILTILIIVFIFLIINFNNQNKNLTKENKELYQHFNENELLDVNGEVNLISLEIEREEEKQLAIHLFEQEDLTLKEANSILEEKELKNENLKTEIDSLNSKIKDLNNQVSTLTSQYQKLKKEKQKQTSTSNTYQIKNVPTINQYPNYPTGCESVAITILLKYYNINVTPNDIISKLKKGKLPYTENGITYGGNPELEFIGNPLSSNSYGVYEQPIADVADQYKKGINRKNNFEFEEVLKLVKNNRPVVVWTSMNLAVPYISKTWTYKPTGELISWKANEHAVVVVGYNDNYVIISDPIGGKIKYQSRSIFKQRYNYYGKKALYY